MARTLLLFLISTSTLVNAQVDTSYLYYPTTSYGVVDVRLATAADQVYYLKENVTFSFREEDGAKTERFLDMTAWDSEKYGEGHLRYKAQTSDDFVMNYRLLKPKHYQDEYEAGYPIVLLLHGLLERGNCAENKCYHASKAYSPLINSPPAPTSGSSELLNNDYNLIHGGVNYLEASALAGDISPDDSNLPPRAFPGFVLVPQNLNGWTDDAVNDALRLLRLIIKKYNIDENRVYINGISHGGHAAYKALVRAPWLFAAGVLFSAADDAYVTQRENIERISRVPLWIFQGGKDKRPTQQQTERYVRGFRDAGSNVRYTLYPELGHGTWNKAFMEPDFFAWMLRQKRNNIHVFANDVSLCTTTQVPKLLRLPDGFSGYEWEYNGTLLDETSASISVLSPGTYRGRFFQTDRNGETLWSDWSGVIELTEKIPGAAKLNVTGTRFMPDLNGESNIVLSADKDFEYYYWYKDNGTRLKVSDSVNTLTLHASFGDGSYYLKSSGYDRCTTQSSDTIKLFFNDRAAYSLARPGELAAQAVTPSQCRLTWNDNSDGESGFEIWRRAEKKLGAQPQRWNLVAITESNVVSFLDEGLLPSTIYNYAIRAISNDTRSEYLPHASEDSVEITTAADVDPPVAPNLIEVKGVGIQTIRATWNRTSDNSTIKKYELVLNADTIQLDALDTVAIVEGLQANTSYVVSVIAVDAGDNYSSPSNTLEVSTVVNGLYYQHATGAWQSLTEIDWSLQEFTGVVSNITLKPKTQEDFFNFRFDGYLRIRTDGIYQFRISSDDGSRLQVGDSLVLLNDGVHNLATTTSPIHLMTSGSHRLTIDFFDYDRSDSLLVEYKGPDSQGAWVAIPDEAFASDYVTSVEETEVPGELIVYPNPTATERIQLVLPWFQEKTGRLTVVNTTGQIVKTVFLEIEDHAEITLDDLALPPGIYVFRVDGGNEARSARVVVK